MITVSIIGLVLSALIGIMHFFVPIIFRWKMQLADKPKWLKVSIDWTNYFFSLLLSGSSIILLFFINDVFAKQTFALVLYGFMCFVWLNRVIVTILHHWKKGLLQLYYVAVFSVVFLLILIPFIRILLS